MELSQLVKKLVYSGGALVSSNACSKMEVANADATGRFAVDLDGHGYVWRTQGWLEMQKQREEKFPVPF